MCKSEQDEAQCVVYTKYKKIHCLKHEKLLLPSGLSKLFDLVSALCSNQGVLRMSNINQFLLRVQNGRFVAAGEPAFYVPHGEDTFALNLKYICSYYRRVVGMPLTPAQDTASKSKES